MAFQDKVNVRVAEGSVWNKQTNAPADLFEVPVQMRVDGSRCPCVLAVRQDYETEEIVEVVSCMDSCTAANIVQAWEEEGYDESDCDIVTVSINYSVRYNKPRTPEQKAFHLENEKLRRANVEGNTVFPKDDAKMADVSIDGMFDEE